MICWPVTGTCMKFAKQPSRSVSKSVAAVFIDLEEDDRRLSAGKTNRSSSLKSQVDSPAYTARLTVANYNSLKWYNILGRTKFLEKSGEKINWKHHLLLSTSTRRKPVSKCKSARVQTQLQWEPLIGKLLRIWTWLNKENHAPFEQKLSILRVQLQARICKEACANWCRKKVSPLSPHRILELDLSAVENIKNLKIHPDRKISSTLKKIITTKKRRHFMAGYSIL